MHYTKVINGIAQYIRSEILSQLDGNIGKWVGGVALELAKLESERVFKSACEWAPVKMLNVIDGENVNIEKVYPLFLAEARQGNATLTVQPLPPITFSVTDVENLYRHIMGA